jgi:hypothetical protein
MPDVGNRLTFPTTSCDVEEDGGLTSVGVQRQRCIPGRAAIIIKAPETIIHDSSDSLLATSTVPSAPRSPVVSTPPITALSSSAAVSEDPLPQSRPDQRQFEEDRIEPESRTDHQLVLSASA